MVPSVSHPRFMRADRLHPHAQRAPPTAPVQTHEYDRSREEKRVRGLKRVNIKEHVVIHDCDGRLIKAAAVVNM